VNRLADAILWQGRWQDHCALLPAGLSSSPPVFLCDWIEAEELRANVAIRASTRILAAHGQKPHDDTPIF
jgi:hypothetical protein